VSGSRLRFGVSGSEASLELDDVDLVVAGFTGRELSDVQAHIAELEAQGIECPVQVPHFYHMPNWILRVGDGRHETQVSATTTSGEAEPVLILLPDGRRFVSVGSDQTDRHFERQSIRLSKLLCPKFVAPFAWPYEDVMDGWDSLRLSSYVGDSRQPYQQAPLAEILPPEIVVQRCQEALSLVRGRPLVIFLGTVALHGGDFSFERRFEAELFDERRGRSLRCVYRVAAVG
jgi:hypothetical protein